MKNTNYEFGTTPKKIQPKYKPNQKNKIKKQIKINEEQRQEALKMEKKKHFQNVVLVMAVFLILLIISYRSSLINEKFSEIQKYKNNLASIEKTNGQLQVSIESSLNLSNIEEAARDKLGMQKLDNSQKVYITLDKKDYVEVGTEEIDIEENENTNWFKEIINKIIRK